jgi:predicted Rossmann-fold nucleotide-binding protein
MGSGKKISKKMIDPQRILVSGGRDYHGPTATRDREVCFALGKLLSDYEVVTGGTPGIPNDVASASLGPVLDVIAKDDSIEEDYWTMVGNQINRSVVRIGNNFKERRFGLLTLENIEGVLAIQGGKYTTHELLLFAEKGVPVVALSSSGGAAGSTQPYENKVWTPTYNVPDPLKNVEEKSEKEKK